jgi:hypothetical protein
MSQKALARVEDRDLRSVDANGGGELDQERPEEKKEQGSR